MSIFRTEIIETSKARTDFLKWKLIGTAGLGAVGLGLPVPASIAGGYLVLALIPLVCFYVDMISRQIALRILVIASFLRLQGAGEQAAYEVFAKLNRDKGMFEFEDVAQSCSTVVMSLLVFVLGLLKVAPGGGAGACAHLMWAGGQPIDIEKLASWLFILSGLAGVLLTILNHYAYERHIARLDTLVNDTKEMRIIRAMANTKPFPPEAARP